MQKLFSIHKPGSGGQSQTQVLHLEIGVNHIGLQVYNTDDNQITSIEYYQTKTNNFLFLDDAVTAVKNYSILLDKIYGKIKISLLQTDALLVPMELFDASEARKKLNEIYKTEAATFFNDMNAAANIVVAYSLPSISEKYINNNFYNAQICHSYSAILSSIKNNTTSSFFKLIFHGSYFTVAAVKQQQLQILQTYNYVAAEDVLYYLLAIQQQLAFGADETALYISGLINKDSALFALMQQYFHTIQFEVANKNLIEESMTEDLPLHYFTQAV